MKKKLNILCILIVFVIGASLLMPIYNMGYSFGMGVKAGLEATHSPQNEKLLNTSPIVMSMKPDTNKFLYDHDRMRLTDSQTDIPVIWSQGIFLADSNKIPEWSWIVQTIAYILEILLFILMLVSSINFIVNINKDRIFTHHNVKILRKIGVYLLIMSAIEVATGVIREIIVRSMHYSFNGYSVSAYWELPWGNIILGLLSLIMAQVWARGIAMREDQELTI